jgi:hypothetical protein
VKKFNKFLWIPYLIVIVTFFLPSEIISKKENINIFELFTGLVLFTIGVSLIFSGIVSLISKIRKKETYFFRLFLANMIIIEIYFLFVLFRSDNIFIILWISTLSILILVQSIFYKKLGFLYSKFFKFLIETIFRIKIISKKEKKKRR